MKKHHTRGPWLVGKRGHDHVINAENELAWETAIIVDSGNEKRDSANAALIAASPDLLDAAEMNVIDAGAIEQLWRLRRHGTDPMSAVRATLEIVARMRARSEAAIALTTEPRRYPTTPLATADSRPSA